MKKLATAVKGTQHAEFNKKWDWQRLQDLYPEEISSTATNQQESICNEWTTYTNVNNWWFSTNKETVIESGLGKDMPMKFQ